MLPTITFSKCNSALQKFKKVIQKHCEIYRACRDVILAEKDAPDRLLYRKQYKAEYQLE